MGTSDHSVLLVEDEELLLEILSDVLNGLGYQVQACPTFTEAHEAGPFDLAFIDASLPDGKGTDLLPHFRQKYPHARIYLMSGHPRASFPLEIQSQADGILIKPFTVDEFEAVLLNELP